MVYASLWGCLTFCGKGLVVCYYIFLHKTYSACSWCAHCLAPITAAVSFQCGNTTHGDINLAAGMLILKCPTIFIDPVLHEMWLTTWPLIWRHIVRVAISFPIGVYCHPSNRQWLHIIKIPSSFNHEPNIYHLIPVSLNQQPIIYHHTVIPLFSTMIFPLSLESWAQCLSL